MVGAVGVPRLIKAAWLKPGALAVNVGTTFSPEERAMVGDIDRRGIEQVGSLVGGDGGRACQCRGKIHTHT